MYEAYLFNSWAVPSIRVLDKKLEQVLDIKRLNRHRPIEQSVTVLRCVCTYDISLVHTELLSLDACL